MRDYSFNKKKGEASPLKKAAAINLMFYIDKFFLIRYNNYKYLSVRIF